MCFFYGFLVNFLIVVGIECYVCVDYLNLFILCGDNVIVLICLLYYDFCVIMVMGFDYLGFNFIMIFKNCFMVDYGVCNESYICSFVNSLVVFDGILIECLVSCC